MVEVIGEIVIKGEFETAGDIREYVRMLDEYNVPDDAGMLDGQAYLLFRGDAEPIECGEHIPTENRVYDFVVLTHKHDDENADDMMEPLGYSESKFEGKS